MEYRYTAIVLKKQEIGETDRLYTFYSKENGKVRAVARGIRKPGARLASHLENGTLCSITVARTRGTGNITGAFAEERYPNIRNRFEVFQLLFIGLSRFERLVAFEEPDEKLFALLVRFLTCLNGNGGSKEISLRKYRLLTDAFIFQSVDRLGYTMEARVSAVSGRSFEKNDRFVFCPELGGVVLYGEQGRATALPLRRNSVTILRIFQQYPLDMVMKFSVSEEEVREIEHVTRQVFEWIV